jgi:hypothetical protein
MIQCIPPFLITSVKHAQTYKFWFSSVGQNSMSQNVCLDSWLVWSQSIALLYCLIAAPKIKASMNWYTPAHQPVQDVFCPSVSSQG